MIYTSEAHLIALKGPKGEKITEGIIYLYIVKNILNIEVIQNSPTIPKDLKKKLESIDVAIDIDCYNISLVITLTTSLFTIPLACFGSSSCSHIATL